MSIYALQSPAGGFLDEDLKRFNKRFDDWCVQFDNFEDANTASLGLSKRASVNIVEITPMSYPQYFFHTLQGNIHATREMNEKIICIVEPYGGSTYRIAVCDLNTKQVRLTKARYKNILSVEGAFANYTE